MELGLEGRTVLVAGASRGLGFAVAQVLVEEGANVAIVARNQQRVTAAAEALGPAVLPIQADVSISSDCAAAISRCRERFGGVQHLVLSAGGPPPMAADEPTDDQWLAAFQLNFLSAARLARLALPDLRAAHGSVVAITSYAVKEPLPGLVLSNAVRAATVNWVKSLANELGPSGVRFNALGPGRFGTERVREIDRDQAQRTGTTEDAVRTEYEQAIPLRRYGQALEFGRPAAFLISPAASYITGQFLLVDGGVSRTIW